MRNILPLASLGCAVVFILGIIVGGLVIIGYGFKGLLEKSDSSPPTQPLVVKGQPHAQPGAPLRNQDGTLLAARQGFETVAAKSSLMRNPNPLERIPDASIIEYPSGSFNFPAYLSKDRQGQQKLAAVVWAHDGFGGMDKESWKQARPFHDAGFVLMGPSFRGENTNAGRFEMFYGEVDDLLAAVDYAASLPYVDPDRVYVAGYGCGGTLALLAATTGTTNVNAFFSISGLPNSAEFLANNDAGFPEASPPFNTRRPGEAYLRSALPFVGGIRRPTYFFGANTEPMKTQAEEMGRLARAQKIQFVQYNFLRANRANFLEPVIELISGKIADDKNGIQFNMVELQGLFQKKR